MSDDRYKDVINRSEDDQSGMEEFPKEIVQLLMKNHPIKNKETKSDLKDTSHTYIDREEVRSTRKQRLEEARQEYNELEEDVRQKHDSFYTRDTSKEEEGFEDIVQKKAGADRKPEKEPSFDTTTLFDDDEDMVQLVRRTSRSSRKNGYRKGFSPGNVDEIGNIEKVLEEKVENQEKPVMQRSQRKPRKKEFNEVEERYYNIEKPEDKTRVLDVFFDENEDYEDDEKTMNLKYIVSGVCVFAVILIVFLGYRSISLSGKLSEATAKADGYEELQVKNEELKLTILSLQEELENAPSNVTSLPVDDVGENGSPAEGSDDGIVTPSEITNGAQTPQETQASQGTQAQSYTEYTVVDGDSYWTIAEKTLGGGVNYQKILDANQLTENDSIKAGQVLKIPN